MRNGQSCVAEDGGNGCCSVPATKQEPFDQAMLCFDPQKQLFTMKAGDYGEYSISVLKNADNSFSAYWNTTQTEKSQWPFNAAVDEMINHNGRYCHGKEECCDSSVSNLPFQCQTSNSHSSSFLSSMVGATGVRRLGALLSADDAVSIEVKKVKDVDHWGDAGEVVTVTRQAISYTITPYDAVNYQTYFRGSGGPFSNEYMVVHDLTPIPPSDPGGGGGNVGTDIIIGVVVVLVLVLLGFGLRYFWSKQMAGARGVAATPDTVIQTGHSADQDDSPYTGVSLGVVQDRNGESKSSVGAADSRTPPLGSERCTIFLSLRFTSGPLKTYAKFLKEHLEESGHRVFLCSVSAGQTFGPQIMSALRSCQFFIALLTLDPLYGENSGGTYTTYFELQYAVEHKKTICPVMMYPGDWPPNMLAEALEDAGCHEGADLVSYALMPSLVAIKSPEMTQDAARTTAMKLRRSISRP